MDKNKVFRILSEMARMTKADITPFTLELYEESLEPLGWDRVGSALRRMFENLRKFPTIQEIKAEMGIMAPRAPDEKDEALVIAGKIIAAITQFGYYQEKDARKALGEEAWEVVRQTGGWTIICDIQTDDLPTARAQLRDLATALKRTKFSRLELSESSTFDVKALIEETSKHCEI